MKGNAPTSLPPLLASLRFVPAIFVDASGTILGGSPVTGAITLYPDALRLIQGFRARRCGSRTIKTGLITNWGRRVNQALAQLDLASVFDAVVCADDVREGKPDPAMFAHAAALLGAEPSECLHVGDSLWDDAVGAQECGWQGVWLNRDGKAALRDQEYYNRLEPKPLLTTSLDEFWRALESL